MEQTLSNFNVTDYNRFTYNIIKDITDKRENNYSPILVVGKNGVGKTHLIVGLENEMKDKSNVIRISSEQFINETIQAINNKAVNSIYEKYEKVDILIIENAEFISSKKKIIGVLYKLMKKLIVENSKIVLLTFGISYKTFQEVKILSEFGFIDFENTVIADITSSKNDYGECRDISL